MNLTEMFLDRLKDSDNDYDDAMKSMLLDTDASIDDVRAALDEDEVPTAFYDDVIDTYLGLTGVWWSSPDFAYRGTLAVYEEAGLTEDALWTMLERFHGL